MFSNNSRMFSNSKYGNLLTVILVIAIIAIIGIIGFIGYSLYRKYYIEKGAEEAVAQFENLVGDNNSTTQEDITGIDNTALENVTTSSGQILTYKGFNVVGIIQIPAIDLRYPILEKVTKKSLETSVAWLYGPGMNVVGNNVIIGHNYRNGTMFSDVNELENGNAIYITDLTGNRVKYIVYNKYTTSGNDASYMTRDTAGKREISLSTCADNSKKRTIVWAREE